MLKQAGKWQELSVEQRLVLLAISHELPNVSGLGILSSDVASITGLPRVNIAAASLGLAKEGLLRVDLDPVMLYLSGDAVTQDLCGEKLALFEEAEKPFWKRVVATSTPIQPTA